LLAAPVTGSALAPFLASPSPTVRIYAAWRLERGEGAPGAIFGREFTVRSALRVVDEAAGGH
jgi:hypothetical protein